MVRTFKPMYKKIETYIIDQIRSGNWKPGSRIPSENELAEQFSVSRITVKNALTALVDKEVVYRLQGKGTFVNDHSPEEIHNITSAVKEQLTAPTIGFLLPVSTIGLPPIC